MCFLNARKFKFTVYHDVLPPPPVTEWNTPLSRDKQSSATSLWQWNVLILTRPSYPVYLRPVVMPLFYRNFLLSLIRVLLWAIWFRRHRFDPARSTQERPWCTEGRHPRTRWRRTNHCRDFRFTSGKGRFIFQTFFRNFTALHFLGFLFPRWEHDLGFGGGWIGFFLDPWLCRIRNWIRLWSSGLVWIRMVWSTRRGVQHASLAVHQFWVELRHLHDRATYREFPVQFQGMQFREAVLGGHLGQLGDPSFQVNHPIQFWFQLLHTNQQNWKSFRNQNWQNILGEPREASAKLMWVHQCSIRGGTPSKYSHPWFYLTLSWYTVKNTLLTPP